MEKNESILRKIILRDINKVKKQKLLDNLANTIEEIKSANEIFSLANIKKLKLDDVINIFSCRGALKE